MVEKRIVKETEGKKMEERNSRKMISNRKGPRQKGEPGGGMEEGKDLERSMKKETGPHEGVQRGVSKHTKKSR